MSSQIKIARVKTGMTQEEAAGTLDVHPTTLNKYESGARYPSGKVLQRMSAAYKVTMETLIDTNLNVEPQIIEEDQKMKEKLALVEQEVLSLYRENRMLKDELGKLQKKVGVQKKVI